MTSRFSQLPVQQFCAKSRAITLGAGRSAAISSAFHARCAATPGHESLYARLTPDEQEECDALQPPPPFSVNGHEFSYGAAHKELALGLDDFGCSVPHGDPSAVVHGTLDMAWFHDGVAYVPDIKRSEWTAPPDSLQILGYAVAFAAWLTAQGHVVRGIVTGVWAATEGVYSWGAYIALDSPEWDALVARLMAAARNTDGDYAMGPHCRECYGRSRCPVYLVPLDGAEGWVSHYLSAPLDSERAFELRTFYERVKATLETADAQIKASADKLGGIRDGAGKVYKAIPVAGRVTIDNKALEKDNPELVQKYVRTGKQGLQYRWLVER